ncbi:DUF3575 domain-containing protein [Myxococcus sp. AM011]|uniref:DUF3575 domain-containing protein n=1 Tax=Myxococcus sp. AM011 TaxID=2745200 RepID=UPI001596010D|nr:DUF3575 domain-containing protein [Myxococcus sp. AM011]NVJ22925.1 DUF3575 domain-containing protein [Myxococcus sp. AM011]
MKCHPHRLGLLTGLLATPLVALAQDDTSSRTHHRQGTQSGPASWLAALNIGIRGHSLGVDEGLAKTPALTVNMEQQLLPHFTVYGGPHAGLDFNAIGFQVGSRFFLSSEQTFHGFFMSAQASYTAFEVDSNTDATRKSLAGLVGYAHPLGNRWLVTLGAGAQSTHTRTETVRPPTLCLFGFCSGSDILDKVEHEKAVEPLVQMGATFRF